MYISHLFVVTFYSNLFPPHSFSYISDDRGRRSFLSLVARIALLSQSCSTEDQIEETIIWFLTQASFEFFTVGSEDTLMPLWEIFTTFLAICGATAAFCFYHFYVVPRRNPLWMLCGPPRRNLFFSHMGMVLE
jgi:hypothetical protein